MRYTFEKAIKYTISAVRASASIRLIKEHDMKETEVAKSLGIAQAAVSKYISGRYSDKIRSLVVIIKMHKLDSRVVKAILLKKDRQEIMKLIDKAASDRGLVDAAVTN